MSRNNVSHASRRNRFLQRKALALAIGSIALGVAGGAWAQATTGTIYGTVPAVAGETIQIIGGAGFNRTITVGPSGKYSTTVPVGTYTVSLVQNGKIVSTQRDISPVAAGAVEVDFTAKTAVKPSETLNAINVTANAIPVIDVKTTNQVLTITQQQLQVLPLGRSAEDIAMLAPGVQPGSAVLVGGPLGTAAVTFGGASTAENQYYIDGMLTSAVLDNQGGIGLPYNSIEQQQTYISGYGAKYGRSIGGVINQIGRSGSNEWHFGFRAQWTPKDWQATPDNTYWNNPYVTTPGLMKGDLYQYAQNDHSMNTVYDAYVSGPIVKDKLFFFLSAERDDSKSYSLGCEFCAATFSQTHTPKLYLKVNWNINDSNFLTATALQSSLKTWAWNYNNDYTTYQPTTFYSQGQTGKNIYRMLALNYTSYITDDLTLHAMVGKSREEYGTTQPSYPGFDPSLPFVGSISNENPAFTPNGPIKNPQYLTIGPDNHQVNLLDYRVDLDYKWRNHDFQFGIDNDVQSDLNDGVQTTGPGYGWAYGKIGTADLGKPIIGTDPNTPPYVAPVTSNPAGAGGYYVTKLIQSYFPSTRVVEHAQYIQDRWQITPRFLLTLGLRNDQFVNYDAAGRPYIRLTKPNWSPRIGFSWDVHGDSTLKVFGNAGRYYLTLPVGVGTTVAAPVVNISEYGTYTGIDQVTGAPTGFQPLPQNPAGGVSCCNQYGYPRNNLTVASQNIKAPYSDNFVLGMQQQLNFLDTRWVFGATGTFEKLGEMIGGTDDSLSMCAEGVREGYTWMTPQTCSQWIQSPVMVNPGVDQKIYVKAPDGSLRLINWTAQDQTFQMGPKRNYYSLDLSLTHEWDGKWFAKFDYVFSRLYGNDAGPVGPMYESSGVVAYLTAVWAYPRIMDNSNGLLGTNRKHSFKIYGAYAITPDWIVGANLWIASGTPRMCRGAYGPNQIRLHTGSQYHWCAGIPIAPGSGVPPDGTKSTPWIHNVNLSVDYKPGWAQHKLDFKLQVFNVFNKQTPTFYGDYFITTGSPGFYYNMIEARMPPRSAQFSIAYNW
ncbi:MAG: TonB-dependent receptor [Rhodanobacteraceae bacterium]|nr:MAG: TonB-dependent receptor [Rhodanobacteraceae bacterium]